MSQPGEPVYEVVWPLAELAGDGGSVVSERAADLNGKTIAELLDMSQLDTWFPTLRPELQRRFPDATIIPFERFGLTHGPDEHNVIAQLPDKLREWRVDAAISALGA